MSSFMLLAQVTLLVTSSTLSTTKGTKQSTTKSCKASNQNTRVMFLF